MNPDRTLSFALWQRSSVNCIVEGRPAIWLAASAKAKVGSSARSARGEVRSLLPLEEGTAANTVTEKARSNAITSR